MKRVWTSEQLEAIEKSGTNIIVSAGAGSGKTAVLSERVLRKIQNGTHVNELLILTFTNAAAKEMKDRIRKNIKGDPNLSKELELLSSSYITTFDSYALSIVKKYYYLLNISNEINITDESYVSLCAENVLDSIFNEKYESEDEDFLYLIDNYCNKNDKELKSSILKLANSIDSFIDKKEVINFIKNNYFNDDNFNKYIEDFKSFINAKKEYLKLLIDSFDDEGSGLKEKIYNSLSGLIECNINDLHMYTNISLPQAPRGSSEEVKEGKKEIADAAKEITKYSSLGDINSIKEKLYSNERVTKVIINIISEYIEKLSKFKLENKMFTFNDIASLAIKILEENENVRNEIKYSFKEIMIDEYQDTNDVQDKFMSLIENNNVYMVGDIKQSIYRFRGSNPSIFKIKYDDYSKNNGGIKIDLTSNFRSRYEVLKNINDIFDLIMDSDIGGADYKVSHRMVFGNKTYEEVKDKNFNYNMKILEYENDTEYENQEIEIFTIAKDIKEKINNKMQIFDDGKLRDAKYSDFAIILDRSETFDNIKKIFEYLSIPVSIQKDEKLTSTSDISLIKHLFSYINKINKNEYDRDFIHDYMSIARSFLYELDDNSIFKIIKNKNYKDSIVYKELSKITSINSKTCPVLLEEILNITDYYNKLNRIGDYENTNVRIKTIYEQCNTLNSLGLTIDEYIEYLNNVIESGYEIKYKAYSTSDDSVKVVTIHGSKGLEYHVCYFADIAHKFNLRDTKDKFIIDKKYGIIITGDEEVNLLKELNKYNYIKEEISERLRLLYVAITRAKENFIIVLPYKDTKKLEKDENGVISIIRRNNFLRLGDFIYAVKDYLSEYCETVDINSLNLTRDYLNKKSINKKLDSTEEELIVNEIHINNEEIESKHYSKEVNDIIDVETKKNMEFGTKIHEVFELIDFKNPNYDDIEEDFIKNKIHKFFDNELLKNVCNANVYHEYEYVYQKEDISYNGIIDLMLEYDDHIDIIDFKLSHVTDENYIKQLNGYRDYISTISNKKINIYLYSILNEEFKSL